MSEFPPGYPPPPDDYGQPPPPPSGVSGHSLPPPPGEELRYLPPLGINTFAKYSLGFSTVGILACGIGPIAGFILGFMALNQIKQTGERGRGIALAGVIIGVVVLVAEVRSII